MKKVIWITGGGTGIGKAVASKFANQGWNVAISGRRETILKEVENSNQNIKSFPLDVNVKERVESFEVAPSFTSAAVIVIVGDVLSYVQLNCVAAVLLLPTASVNLLAATSIVQAPSPVGVNVAV